MVHRLSISMVCSSSITMCVLLVAISEGAGATRNQAVFLHHRVLDGLLGLTSASGVKARSRLECSCLCLRDVDCFSFTFSAISGDCFLHDHFPLPGASHLGARTFYKKWDSCPADWTLLNRTFCVKLFAENVDWDTAAQRCQSHGGNLISLQTSVKDTVVRSCIETTATSSVWTGGHKVNGQWVWEATGKAATGISWGAGEPNFDGENCLGVYQYDFHIHNAPCDYAWHYMCEIPN